MVRPPKNLIKFLTLGVFALKLELKFLILNGCTAFFVGWFHLARFWEIWIASVLNFLRDGFGDNIEIICGASETFRKYPLILNYWYNG